MNKKLLKEINEKLDQMLSVLKFFQIGSGQLAIFNTHDTISLSKINNLLRKVLTTNTDYLK